MNVEQGITLGLFFGLVGCADSGTPETAQDDSAMRHETMAARESGTVHLSGEQMRTAGVTFGEAKEQVLTRTIRAVGLVDFDDKRMTYVAPKFGGYIERLHVDFLGAPVSRGQLLLEIYSPELVSAQEELLLAARLAETVGTSAVEGVAEGSTDLVEAAERRLRYWDISQPQIDRILASGQVRRALGLFAPATGIIMEIDAVEGQAVGEGDNLYMIADLSVVWVEAELFEVDAALVEAGMDAEIEVTALPGQTFRGTVEYVYPTFKQETRAMTARISLPNPEGRLKPGMYATVRLALDLGTRLAIPRSAILETGDSQIVFVDEGEGRLGIREVQLGVRADEHVALLDGVRSGERVVTSAQFLIDSEANLAEVMAAMIGQMDMGE